MPSNDAVVSIACWLRCQVTVGLSSVVVVTLTSIRGPSKNTDTPAAAHPRRLDPPPMLTWQSHAALSRAARGIHGCTTSGAPIIFGRTPRPRVPAHGVRRRHAAAALGRCLGGPRRRRDRPRRLRREPGGRCGPGALTRRAAGAYAAAGTGTWRLDGGDLAHLGQAEVVARRVAEAAVDSVGPLLGRLVELDAAGLERLVIAVDVVGGEEDGPGGALGHEGAHLLGGLVVEDGRAGDGHEHDRDVLLAGRADGEPAEVADLGQGHVGADLHAELLRVEGEGLS